MDEEGPFVTLPAQQGAAANKVPTTPALTDAAGTVVVATAAAHDRGWSGTVRDGRPTCQGGTADGAR
jgi:hypothetical protein